MRAKLPTAARYRAIAARPPLIRPRAGPQPPSPKGEGIPKSARDHIHRHVEDLGNLQNRVDVVAGGGGHVVGGAGLAVCDCLRRAKVDVKLVSIMGRKMVTGSHGFKIEADCLFEEIGDDADVLFLPGGLVGTNNLKAHRGLAEMLKAHAAAGKRLAAICAAPSVLGELGLVEGHRATCYPGFENQMKGADCRGDGVVTDRLISTGRGMGWAIDLGLELIRILVSENEAEKIRKAIQYER